MGAPALTGIVNPVAGGGRARALLAALPRTVAAALTHTRGSGDAARWARRHRRAPVVVVIGGDGTLHEVLNELDLARQAVVLIPGGPATTLAGRWGCPARSRCWPPSRAAGPGGWTCSG